jgi:hypothetical protein
MTYARELIENASRDAGVSSAYAAITGEELAQGLRLLNSVIDGFALKGIMQPEIKQILTSLNNEDEGRPCVKFYDTSTLTWRNLTAEQQQAIIDAPGNIVSADKPLKPKSVQIAYLGSSDIFYEGAYMDPEAFYMHKGTILADNQYPFYWTFQYGDVPKIELLCKTMKPNYIKIAMQMDTYHNIKPETNISNWVMGLDHVVKCALAVEIADANSYDSSVLRRKADEAYQDFKTLTKPKVGYRRDIAAPRTGRVMDHPSLTRSPWIGGT